jgi:hypothetical protein
MITKRSVEEVGRICLAIIQCDSFGTRPQKKWEYLKEYSLDFEHAYMTTIYKYFQHIL